MKRLYLCDLCSRNVHCSREFFQSTTKIINRHRRAFWTSAAFEYRRQWKHERRCSARGRQRASSNECGAALDWRRTTTGFEQHGRHPRVVFGITTLAFGLSSRLISARISSPTGRTDHARRTRKRRRRAVGPRGLFAMGVIEPVSSDYRLNELRDEKGRKREMHIMKKKRTRSHSWRLQSGDATIRAGASSPSTIAFSRSFD